MWITLFWIFTGAGALLFMLQSIFWTSMRMKKLTVTRWTLIARRIRIVGFALLMIGGALFAFGPPAASQAAQWALFSGGFNALIATFHLLTIAYLSGGQAGGLIDRKQPRRSPPPEVDPAASRERPTSVD